MGKIEHSTNEEAVQSAKEGIDSVASTGKWAMIVWCVEDGKIRLEKRTTFAWPTGDWMAALGHLASLLHEDQVQAPDRRLPNTPLPKVFQFPFEVKQKSDGTPSGEVEKGPEDQAQKAEDTYL